MSDSAKPANKGVSRLRYPSLSLPDALSKARVIWEKDRRNSVNSETIAEYWDSRKTSSAFRQWVASLGYFGLLDQAGGAGSGDYRLSGRAIVILAGSEDEKREAIEQAALSPQIYKELWERFGGDGILPSDENLRSRLIIDWRATPKGADSILKDFRRTIEFAKLEKLVQSAEQNHDSTGDQERSSASNKGPGKSSGASANNPGKLIAEFSAPLSGNQLKLSIIGDEPVCLDDLEDIELAVQYLKRQLKKQIEKEAEAKKAEIGSNVIYR